MDIKIGEDQEIWFKNNQTLEERARDRTLGLVKFYLVEEKGYSKAEIRIFWPNQNRKGEVKMKSGDIVAKIGGNDELEVFGEGMDVVEHIRTDMATWWAKRGNGEGGGGAMTDF